MRVANCYYNTSFLLLGIATALHSLCGLLQTLLRSPYCCVSTTLRSRCYGIVNYFVLVASLHNKTLLLSCPELVVQSTFLLFVTTLLYTCCEDTSKPSIRDVEAYDLVLVMSCWTTLLHFCCSITAHCLVIFVRC